MANDFHSALKLSPWVTFETDRIFEVGAGVGAEYGRNIVTLDKKDGVQLRANLMAEVNGGYYQGEGGFNKTSAWVAYPLVGGALEFGSKDFSVQLYTKLGAKIVGARTLELGSIEKESLPVQAHLVGRLGAAVMVGISDKLQLSAGVAGQRSTLNPLTSSEDTAKDPSISILMELGLRYFL